MVIAPARRPEFLMCWAPAAAGADSPDAEIRAALEHWMADFNAGHADKVCDNLRPQPARRRRGCRERDFDAQCGLLRQTPAIPNAPFPMRSISRRSSPTGDMAAVRLKWT